MGSSSPNQQYSSLVIIVSIIQYSKCLSCYKHTKRHWCEQRNRNVAQCLVEQSLIVRLTQSMPLKAARCIKL